ncbi:hypothetical protein PY365_10705 [Roseiarcaceae bacterium H3SJ34-1]|uniref:hypothetical protein n=1 Tax=Terripilifer ovatus TaxID=3032367 RepID=UPI003AB96AE2|nr:hypothetical protein [Roseiarcaceae bacterium H3SJ34-1]
MIDRAGRDKAAILVERYWTGQISSHELQSLWPDSRDRGIIAVGDYLWLFSEDFISRRPRDTVIGKASAVSRMEACKNFLRSNEEYAWPHLATPPWGSTTYPRWLVFASCGLLAIKGRFAEQRLHRYRSEMHAAGDGSAWPFLQQGH